MVQPPGLLRWTRNVLSPSGVVWVLMDTVDDWDVSVVNETVLLRAE